MDISTIDVTILVLLLIVSAVGIATQLVRLPSPIALILTGLAIAIGVRYMPFLRDLPIAAIQLTPRLILVLFLPALLFEATLHIEAAVLRKLGCQSRYWQFQG